MSFKWSIIVQTPFSHHVWRYGMSNTKMSSTYGTGLKARTVQTFLKICTSKKCEVHFFQNLIFFSKIFHSQWNAAMLILNCSSFI